MSRAGGDPLAADRLPVLAAAAAMVGEAIPDPAPGPARDKIADDGAARVDRATALMDAAVRDYVTRLQGVVVARMRGPKARKGTRFWSDQVKSVSGRGDADSYAHRTGVEVKAVRPLDPDQVLPDKTVTEIEDAVRPVGLRIVADAAGSTARALGRPNTGLAAFDWGNIEAAVDSAIENILGAAERQAAMVRREILHADATAESLDAAIDMVTAAMEKGGKWLETYGRTLATALAGDAALGAARSLGVTHAQWLCVAADTEVWTPGVLNVARRWSTEGLLRITTNQGPSGRGGLAVTPDHPMLCQRGWIPARELHPGDYLIRRSLDEGTGWGSPDVQREPTQIGEFFAAANELRPAQRVMRAAVDLDSDRGSGYVDVVAVDGELADRIQPPISQPRDQLLLALSDFDLESLLLSRPGDKQLVGLSPPDIQGGHEGVTTGGYLGRLMGDAVDPRRRPVPPRDAALLSDASDHFGGGGEAALDRSGGLTCDVGRSNAVLVKSAPTPPEDRCSARLRESFRPVDEAPSAGVTGREQHTGSAQATSDGFSAAIDQGGGDLLGSLAELVAADQIVSIEFDAQPTHVYDLQTVTGWFVANGYVVHNSRRDDKVRHTHVEADGQTRLIGDKYQVGAFLLKHPGDSEVLPEGIAEVANCRCSLRFERPAPDKRRAVAAARAGTPSAARALLAAPGTGAMVNADDDSGVPASIPEVVAPAAVVGYRVLESEVPVTPGQRLSWPGMLTLALAPPVAAGVASLAVTLPAGVAVGVAGGAAVLPAGAVLAVLAVSQGQVVAVPVMPPAPVGPAVGTSPPPPGH